MKAREARRSSAAAKKQRRLSSGAPATVTVTFRHVQPSDAFRVYAERKLAHVAKYLRRPCEVHLILAVDKYRQHGEVTVKSGRLSVTAQEETKDLYSVIDLLAGKVERQLKKHVEKKQARKVRALSAGEVLSEAEQSEPLRPGRA
jgi:putative sigma-54 modulation protein